MVMQKRYESINSAIRVCMGVKRGRPN